MSLKTFHKCVKGRLGEKLNVLILQSDYIKDDKKLSLTTPVERQVRLFGFWAIRLQNVLKKIDDAVW